MAQIFHPSTNVLSKLTLIGVAAGVPVLGTGAYYASQSYGSEVLLPKAQPIPFSHKHHVGD
ncbi:MAG: cytochrome C, partial [Armatimonadetes bacterium]|nr:cytochrome C [Armatimonadota bacterium]